MSQSTLLSRHLANELDNALRVSAREAESLTTQLRRVADLHDDPAAAGDLVLSLGQEFAMLARSLAEVAAKHAAIEGIKLAEEMKEQ